MTRLFLFVLLSLISFSVQAQTLKMVKERGQLLCGVTDGLAGFSTPDSEGKWTGMDVDICHALAAALFGDAKKVRFVPLSAGQRFASLTSREVDLLVRITTRTLTRDTSLGLNFAPVTYYDGQGFMVRVKDGVAKAEELNGASICIQQGTTTELNAADFFRQKKIKFSPVVFESNTEAVQTFIKGRCDAFTTDISGLAAERGVLKNAKDYKILPDVISKEPLAPAVRHGDDAWFDIVSWLVFALIEAEEIGITAKNIESFMKSQDPRVRRFLGLIPGNGAALGLDEKWAYHAIKSMGNYGEIFERNVGASTPLNLERGLNALWTEGGLMYAPPLR